MKLSQECILLQSELKKFAQQVLADKVDELDKLRTFPHDNVQRLAQMGIVGAMVPETYGGAALDTIGFAVVLEEISRVCASTAFVVATHNVFFAFPILKFGTDEMRRKYLPKAASGEFIGGCALPRTNEFSIVPQPNRPCVNGKNPFVLNASANGPFIIFIPDAGSNDLTACVLDHGTPGTRLSKLSETIGLRAAGISEYVFENCCPPEMNIIGERQQAQKILENTHALARVLLAAISLGIAQGAAEAALKYAKERIQFQQPIIDFGMVREQVAEMSVNIEAARNLVYEAAMRIDQGEEYRGAAAMAKLFAGQSATAATVAAIQIYGGYGYMKDYPAERYFRDAHMLNVICSTPDEDKELIVKSMM